MKVLITVSIFLFIPLSVWAVEYHELDRSQVRLEASYQEAYKAAGSSEQIREYIKNKDPKNLKSSIKKIETFFSEYDQFNLTKIDTFMRDALKDLENKLSLAQPSLNTFERKNLKKRLVKIQGHYNDYQSRKIHFGKEDDFLRVQSGRAFFNAVGKFSNKLKKAMGDKANRIWGIRLLPFIDTPKEMAPITGDFLKLLHSSYFKARKNSPNEAPIIDSLRNISQKIAETRGTQTQWFGLENLQPMPLDGESINILVFMHANSYYDTSVQGTLELEGLSSIGNVDVIFPKFLAKRMIKSDHIVAVGHGDVLGKIETIIRSQQLNKFFIAPEGMTPVGFYEMRPLVDIFSDSIYALLDRGLKVNLYPISFPDNFRFMNDYRRPIEGEKPAYGIIHPLLHSQDMLDLLNMTGDRQALSHLIRWIWFKELNNDNNHDIGMPKPTIMKEWFDGMIWGNL